MRLVSWYLSTLWNAVDTVLPGLGTKKARLPGAVTGLRFTGQVAASEWLSDHETNLVEVIHHAIGERLVDTTVALNAAERFGRYFTACDHLEHYRQLCDAATAWVSGVPNDPPAARDRARRRLGTAGGPHRKVPGL